jgi:uncharacterized membrane protein
MAYYAEVFAIVFAVGLVLLLVYAYLAAIERILVSVGFTVREASTLLLLTLFLGWVPIPIFMYNGWWVAVSVGGAAIPLAICYTLFRSRRVELAEVAIGVTIVTYVTYFVTRAEEGVGIVADVPMAFAPALAAGLFSLSVFWKDLRKAAPLAYVSGVLGTLIGADVLHLGEILSYEAPEGDYAILSVGGGNIFDMVYLTGIIAVAVAIVVLRIRKRQEEYGYSYLEDIVGVDEGISPKRKEFAFAPALFEKIREQLK